MKKLPFLFLFILLHGQCSHAQDTPTQKKPHEKSVAVVGSRGKDFDFVRQLACEGPADNQFGVFGLDVKNIKVNIPPTAANETVQGQLGLDLIDESLNMLTKGEADTAHFFVFSHMLPKLFCDSKMGDFLMEDYFLQIFEKANKIGGLDGKKLIFYLDGCYAGSAKNAMKDALKKSSLRTGRKPELYLVVSSSEDKVSYRRYQKSPPLLKAFELEQYILGESDTGCPLGIDDLAPGVCSSSGPQIFKVQLGQLTEIDPLSIDEVLARIKKLGKLDLRGKNLDEKLANNRKRVEALTEAIFSLKERGKKGWEALLKLAENIANKNSFNLVDFQYATILTKTISEAIKGFGSIKERDEHLTADTIEKLSVVFKLYDQLDIFQLNLTKASDEDFQKLLYDPKVDLRILGLEKFDNKTESFKQAFVPMSGLSNQLVLLGINLFSRPGMTEESWNKVKKTLENTTLAKETKTTSKRKKGRIEEFYDIVKKFADSQSQFDMALLTGDEAKGFAAMQSFVLTSGGSEAIINFLQSTAPPEDKLKVLRLLNRKSVIHSKIPILQQGYHLVDLQNAVGNLINDVGTKKSPKAVKVLAIKTLPLFENRQNTVKYLTDILQSPLSEDYKEFENVVSAAAQNLVETFGIEGQKYLIEILEKNKDSENNSLSGPAIKAIIQSGFFKIIDRAPENLKVLAPLMKAIADDKIDQNIKSILKKELSEHLKKLMGKTKGTFFSFRPKKLSPEARSKIAILKELEHLLDKKSNLKKSK